MIALAVLLFTAFTSAEAANTLLEITTFVPDSACAGRLFNICAELTESCGGGVYAPLPNRPIGFYLDEGSCGLGGSVIPAASAYTDSNGIACVTITLPLVNGGYSLRVKFDGEAKPGALDPPNSACNPLFRVQLSASNDCRSLIITENACEYPPYAHCPGDTTILLCDMEEICLTDFYCTDPDTNLISCSVSLGTLSGDTVCFTPTGAGTYDIILTAVDEHLNTASCTTSVTIELSSPPVVSLPNDTAIYLCSPAELCFPVDITDVDCNIVSVATSYGSYAGTASGFDQIARLVELGAVVTQVGGGAPGANLTQAADFVAPINTQSGVSVSLPNFGFADFVLDYGTLPMGSLPINSADHLLGAPTDLTFTTVGAGGPDGGDGDGSVAFAPGDSCILGLYSPVTTCDGSPTDLFLLTNTGSAGSVRLDFYIGAMLAHSVAQTIPAGATGSGTGGVTLDLPDGITYDAIGIVGLSGAPEVDGVASRTAPSSSTADVCFTPTASGLYDVIVTATDACGGVGADTMTVTLTINQPPVANAGSDFNVLQCAPAEICFGVTFSDPEGMLALTEKVSGPGALTGNQICFTPSGAGSYTFVIRAVDVCNVADYDTVVVTVEGNHRPEAVMPPDITVFQCAASQLCHQFTATDSDGDSLTWTKLAGAGTVTPDGLFCFTPTASGIYSVAVVAADSCGAADTSSIQYTVTLNSAPVANNPGAAVNLFQCVYAQVCYGFSAVDVNGGTLTWTKLSGSGAVSPSGQWCFVPNADGSYAVTVQVADSCGAADTVSHAYNITSNQPPVVAMGADTALFLCAPQAICLSYTVSDPNAGDVLTETMLAGFGSIDTAANQICFTPSISGMYQFIVQVADGCGATDVDTAGVLVNFGQAAVITCPTEPIAVSLCTPDQICQMLAVSPASATVTTSFGTWSAGQLCFQADTSGTYVITVIADASCGSDTCTLTFNVEIGVAASITCPAAQSVSLCAPDTVCAPVNINGSDLSVTVSPVGWYSAGNVCFVADTSGTYDLTVIAVTPCGSDTCTFATTVQINAPPVATDPVSPVDTFICAPAQICYQFAATDPDGDPLSWARLSGSGTVSASGLWCFTGAAGSYSVVAEVFDGCLAKDTVALTYNVAVNSDPTLSLGNDTTLFECVAGITCLFYSATDPDDNISSVQIISGDPSAYINMGSSLLCFNPPNPGSYEFVVRATDACGRTDQDTLVVTIAVNHAPVVNLGADQNVFACALQQYCIPASVTDADNNLTSVQLLSGPGTLAGGQICFTPAAPGAYQFIVRATDACNVSDYDTVVVVYSVNSPPVVDAGADQNLFLCAAGPICWPASATDADNNITSAGLIQGPGTFDGSQICFTPAGDGTYLFVLRATDQCGATDYDSVTVTVALNEPPVCVVPNDTIIFQCAAAEVCLPAYATDPDGNLDVCQIISGPGSLVNGQWCYTPAGDHSVTVVVQCEDSCGATCQSQFTVEFDINGAPQIAFGADIDTFLCTGAAICLPYTASDPEGLGTTLITLVSGPGTLVLPNSEVCFTPTESGSYTFVLRIQDQCGSADYDTINVAVEVNTAPVVDAGPDDAVFLCTPGSEVCWPASATDAENNLAIVNLVGPGTFDGSAICFNPTTSGDYSFILEATDACGRYAADTVTINIINNEVPIVQLPNDFPVYSCGPEEVCFNYNAIDLDGTVLTEVMVAGFGAIDTANNRICFTPTDTGHYQFIVQIADSCGATDADTLTVRIDFREFAAIDCPVDPVSVTLCEPGTVCYALDIQPADAVVTSTLGSYSAGELCFNAPASGVYVDTVIAANYCSTDTCIITFNVDIRPETQITCPDPQTIDICAPDTVCVPVTVVMRDEVIVSPIGWYSGGSVCFFADTAGHYELTVIASTSCGADTCTIVADISINAPPVVQDPPAVDTFMCAPAQICYAFDISDPEGDPLTCSRLSGPGTVTSAGVWCFMPTTAGTYTVVVRVADPCGAADTTSLTYTISLNGPPVVDLGGSKLNKLTVFQCDPVDQCVDYTVADPNDNVVLEQLLAGSAVLDTALNRFCFTADTAGTYRFIMRVEDACGAADEDTLDVTVQVNHAPTAAAGADQQVFMCAAVELCWPASCSDPDNNLDSCYVTTPAGFYSGGEICFTPDTSGVYTIILRSVDLCGVADEDTAVVTVDLNDAPVCQLPSDTSISQCSPAAVHLPVNVIDTDGNFDRCEILAGPGSIQGGEWVYLPAADQSVNVQIMCLDSCGTVCQDQFTVTFDVNEPPIVNAGPDTTYFLCGPQQVCRPVTVTDDENNLVSTTVISPAGGTYAGGQVCFNTTLGQTSYSVIVEASDACGRVRRDTSVVTVKYNHAPTLALTPDFAVYLDFPGELCFNAVVADVDNNLSSVTVTTPATISGDEACFFADTSGVYCFVVSATDGCGVAAVDTICIDVQIDECIHVQIEKTHNAYQGEHEPVNVFQQGSGKELGGFDLLIQYDPSALLFNGAAPGDLLTACGWEYFTYRQGPDGNCSGCPTGLVRLVAIAETNNGANHPGCFLNDVVGSLAELDFLVSNDRNLECQYVPIRFFWVDCGDNTVSSRLGDTLWISRRVFDFELNELTNTTGVLPGFAGAPDMCLSNGGPDKPSNVRCVDFTNGGIDIVCADSIDARGDLNLNGAAYEISDAVLYSNFFVYGLGVFDYYEAQVAASDVNADGIPLSVADLVYLIRVIVGDTPPLPKLDPNAPSEVEFALTDGVLEITRTEYRIGAIALTIEGEVAPELLPDAQGMEMRYSFDGTETRVLVYNFQAAASLQGGQVLKLGSVRSIKSIDVGAFDGFRLGAKVNALPERFELYQNYPNPFNPTTTIEFDLPKATDWQITIYNVLGQTVQTLKGEDDAGYMKVVWDAGKFASGVYLYRLKAGEFTATRKMVLIK